MSIDDAVSRNAASYSVKLNITPSSGGVTLVEGLETISANHPPLFPGQDPLDFPQAGGLGVADNLSSGQLPIDDQDGLFRVHYTVQPGTTGTFDVSIDTSQTFFFDGSANVVPYDGTVSGTISVSAVPEPSVWIVGMFTVMGVIVHSRWRRWLSVLGMSNQSVQ